jgi:hypothetical protein
MDRTIFMQKGGRSHETVPYPQLAGATNYDCGSLPESFLPYGRREVKRGFRYELACFAPGSLSGWSRRFFCAHDAGTSRRSPGIIFPAILIFKECAFSWNL